MNDYHRYFEARHKKFDPNFNVVGFIQASSNVYSILFKLPEEEELSHCVYINKHTPEQNRQDEYKTCEEVRTVRYSREKREHGDPFKMDFKITKIDDTVVSDVTKITKLTLDKFKITLYKMTTVPDAPHDISNQSSTCVYDMSIGENDYVQDVYECS